ncbi:glycosyltransferase family 9 protein [candidate division TA06 bacterium]|uniref:Glycosyltransferase family 9 protein n=1 Tax=candidate division TA06 bacterium TaxID=2250710 RepID=A0A933IBK3_UNCT6|nr:glycosyltransferase family 9 protein [candidate division TA06 bacterium]
MRYKPAEKIFKKAMIGLFSAFLPDVLYSPDQVKLDSVKSILVIRQHDQLGDLILTTPVYRALRQRFPQARITAMARYYTHPVLHNNPNIDRVLVYPEKLKLATPKRLFQLLKGLRQSYDLCIVLNTVSHSLSSDVLGLLSGARYRLGTSELPFYDFRPNLFYNILSAPPTFPLHETKRSLLITERLGITTDDLSEEVCLTPEEQEQGRKLLWDRHLIPEKTIGLNLGAYNMPNRWPYRKYAALADWLASEFGFQIAVFWGPRENNLGERFLGAVNVKVTALPGLDVRQLAGVLRQLRLVVCNNTGIMHLSAAVGAPTFAIFGQNDPELWRPLNKNFYGVRGLDKTCASAELEVVQSGIKRMLDRMDSIT